MSWAPTRRRCRPAAGRRPGAPPAAARRRTGRARPAPSTAGTVRPAARGTPGRCRVPALGDATAAHRVGDDHLVRAAERGERADQPGGAEDGRLARVDRCGQIPGRGHRRRAGGHRVEPGTEPDRADRHRPARRDPPCLPERRGLCGQRLAHAVPVLSVEGRGDRVGDVVEQVERQVGGPVEFGEVRPGAAAEPHRAAAQRADRRGPPSAGRCRPPARVGPARRTS